MTQDDQDTVRITVAARIDEVARDAWDACANPSGVPFNPFISHDFLGALEASGSVGKRSGWLPQHLVATDAAGRVAGVCPCYLKSHSRGEYVFDWGWAEAYERAGGDYYPKLQVSVPFTPATGRPCSPLPARAEPSSRPRSPRGWWNSPVCARPRRPT
jgi:uncharacterized protein